MKNINTAFLVTQLINVRAKLESAPPGSTALVLNHSHTTLSLSRSAYKERKIDSVLERAIYQEGASTLICAHFGYFSTASQGDHSIICVRAQSFLSLFDPVDLAHQVPLSIGFSRQKYWNGLLFPSPGDLPDLGIEPTSVSLALAGGFFTTTSPGKPCKASQGYSKHN